MGVININYMEEEAVLTEKNKKTGKHLFQPGESGNPAGRPVGSVSIVEAIKRKLQDVDPVSKRKYLDLVVDAMFVKAVADNDVSMLKDLTDRVDGKAPQKVEMDLNGQMKYTMLETGIKNLLHESSTDQIAEAGGDALQDGGGQANVVDGKSAQDLSNDNDKINAESLAISAHSIREVLDGGVGGSDTSE